LLDGVTGPELFGLEYEAQVVCAEGGFDLFGAVADDHVDGSLVIQSAGGIQDVLEQGPAGDGLQYFGQARFHAGSLAGSKDDDVQHRIRLPVSGPAARLGVVQPAQTKKE